MKKLSLFLILTFLSFSLTAQLNNLFDQIYVYEVDQTDIGFGASADMEGSVAVIGAKDLTGSRRKGAVRIFYQDQGGIDNWGYLKQVQSPDLASGDMMGGSIDLYGDTFITGAIGTNSGVGAAYIFSKDQGGPDNWGQVQRLSPPNNNISNFGNSVAMNDNYIAVGAHKQNQGAGVVYIYTSTKKADGTRDYALSQTITAPSSSYYAFGETVLLQDGKLIVGSIGFDTGDVGGGRVYVYTFQNGQWTLVNTVTPDVDDSTGYFGSALALSGDYLFVGAPHQNGWGEAFAYKHDGSEYQQIANLKIDGLEPFDTYRFGASFGIYNNFLMVGAPWSGKHGGNIGQVIIYTFKDDNVTNTGLEVPFDFNNQFPNLQFGTKIGITGNFIVVTALADITNDVAKAAFYKISETSLLPIKKESSQLTVYPNPSLGNQLLTIASDEAINAVEIINMIGQRVFNKQYESKDKLQQIDLPNLPQGSYIINVRSLNNIKTNHLMVR